MQLIFQEKEGTLKSCSEVVTAQGPGVEQPSASPPRRAVGEGKNGDKAEKPLLSEATGTAQSEKGCEKQSSLEQSVLKEQEQSSSAQWEQPGEGLGSQETIGNNQLDLSQVPHSTHQLRTHHLLPMRIILL